MIQEKKGEEYVGLSEEEAEKRLAEYGRNELSSAKEQNFLIRFLGQLKDPLIYVLLAACVVSIWLGEVADAALIGIVIGLNALVGVIQEGKARRALEALKALSAPHGIVLRDGVKKEIPAAELVVGDVVFLETGCQVPADLRLLETELLELEESALTGENLPVEKKPNQMAFMTTIVTRGRGMGQVAATGMDTQIGQIASMLSEQAEELTPLQKRLGDLGKLLSALALGLCGALFVLAVLQKRDVMEMLLMAISLAVAAVPEGLPTVVTICLALSVTKMVRQNTIIRKLPSVETLGSVTVVCSDKTGTLTKNCMTVEKSFCFSNSLEMTEAWFREGESEENWKGVSEAFLKGMVLCNDASLTGRLGDPTELALLDYGERYGILEENLKGELPRLGELPFDSERKMMTTFHQDSHGRTISFTKGAPDVVLDRCQYFMSFKGEEKMTSLQKQAIGDCLREMSGDALRTLAVAFYRNGDGPMEENLTFLGLVGMRDPIRPEAKSAVQTFRKAGVKTVMITGDFRETAFAIAKQLQIAQNIHQCMAGEELISLREQELKKEIRERDITVFARVSPAQKVQIVKCFQALGEIVAMTGDGVNDAPSLKIADIGIAMGEKGTDVAKQAADMVLTDDNFATIEGAIGEGRSVYENIRKSVLFLLSSNLGEMMTMFTAVLFSLMAPLKSGHILWVNLITDSLPALALGIDLNDRDELMKNSPRAPGESLFARGGLGCTCFFGALIAMISLAAFLLCPIAILLACGLPVNLGNLRLVLAQTEVLNRAQTYAFTVLGMSQLFHAIGMRDLNISVFRMKHGENKLMLAALAIGVSLQIAVTKVPILIQCFGTVYLSWKEWLLLLGFSVVPLLAHDLLVFLNFGMFLLDKMWYNNGRMKNASE